MSMQKLSTVIGVLKLASFLYLSVKCKVELLLMLSAVGIEN